MKDLVSIVIPVYNGEKYIEKCIDSLLIQSYDRIEIIIIDDGSVDNTELICAQYADKGKIKFLKQKHSGPAQARNLGIANISGKYVAFIDADDYVDKEYISHLVGNLQERDADISSCGWMDVDEFGRIIWTCDQEEVKCYDLKNMIIPENKIPFTVWHMLYKVELLQEGKIKFDSDIYYQEDLLFNYRMLLAANKIVVSTNPLYKRIVNSDSLTNQKWSLEWFEKWFTIVLAQDRIVKMLVGYPKLYGNAIYNQSLETVKIYALSKKYKVEDKEKVALLRDILKRNRKKLRDVKKASIKSMVFTAACCYIPTLYCKIRKYHLR